MTIIFQKAINIRNVLKSRKNFENADCFSSPGVGVSNGKLVVGLVLSHCKSNSENSLVTI